MAQFFSTIGRHLECAIQTELVVELELGTISKLIDAKNDEQCSSGGEGVRIIKVLCLSYKSFLASKVRKMVQFQPLFPELRDLKKMAHAIFFRSAAIFKVLVRPNWEREGECSPSLFMCIILIWYRILVYNIIHIISLSSSIQNILACGTAPNRVVCS